MVIVIVMAGHGGVMTHTCGVTLRCLDVAPS